jgi:hypothetical protein
MYFLFNDNNLDQDHINNLKKDHINKMLKYYYINNNIIKEDNIDYKLRLEKFKKTANYQNENLKNFYFDECYLHKTNKREFIIDKYNEIEIVFIVAIYIRNDNYKNILDEIIKYSKNIIIIYSKNLEYEIDIEYLEELSKRSKIILIEVVNIGYDFFKYYIGINYCLENIKFDRLILLNDSFKFTRPIEDFISYIKLSHNKFNLIGLNNSYEIDLHIQSFIISFDKDICNEFISYYEKYNNKNHKLKDIIDIFEIGFSNYIINNKNYKTDTFYYITTNKNPYLEPLYSNMIQLYNYPIKKTKIL